MATHCSVLACRILWTEDPGKLCRALSCKESDCSDFAHTQCVPVMFRDQKHSRKQSRQSLRLAGAGQQQ